MSFFDALRHRLHVLQRGEEYTDEQAREFAFHLELAAQEHSPFEVDRPDAERAARRGFGNITRYRELAREMSSLAWLDRIRQDLGYAWRGLAREPAFTVTVMITLGLGVGFNAAVFSLLDRVFIRSPEGVAAPRELRRLYLETPFPPRLLDWSPLNRRRSRIIEQFPLKGVNRTTTFAMGERVAAYTPSDSVASGRRTGFVAKRSYVSGNYFAVLGVGLQLGIGFTPEEEAEEQHYGHAAPMHVVISDDLWRRAFRGDASVVGREIRIDNEMYTVVGVAARGFSGIDLDRVDLWSLLYYPRPDLRLVARVPAETTLSRYEKATTARTPQFRQLVCPCLHQPHAGFSEGTENVFDGPIVEALGPLARTPEMSNSIRIAAVAVIVLLIACANVTTLLLLRSARRGREIAVRRALGAARSRLAEQVLVESLLLSALAGIASLSVVYWGGALLRRMLFPSINFSGRVVDFRAIVVVAAVSIAAAVCAGIMPAIGLANPDVMVLLRHGPYDSGSRGARARSVLVILQSALCVALLVGATLLVRTLRNVEAIGAGHDARDMSIGGMSFRFGAELFTALGAVGLVVAAIGIYSVASYAMTERTRELGVRLAFGARTKDVFRLAALHGFVDLVAGVALGALIAAELAPFAASLLIGVKPTDTPTLIGTALAVLVVGTLARIVPAWRASRIDPIRTLAAE